MDKTNDSGSCLAVMGEQIQALGVLSGLLRTDLSVSAVKLQGFEPGKRTEDEVIVTHRFLVIINGSMDYTVEGRTVRLGQGVQFFVPAWSRREWVAGTTGCRLSWCEFSSEAVLVPPVLCWRELKSPRIELRAFERMSRLHKSHGPADALLLEAELKSALARFWSDAHIAEGASTHSREKHPEVSRALVWLEQHYAESDALNAFYATVALSPNHFRLLFRRQTGETVQAVLARLRLRRARYLVRETSMPMKQIAAEAGFADPLYFSNQYKRFWGLAASVDRSGGGVA